MNITHLPDGMYRVSLCLIILEYAYKCLHVQNVNSSYRACSLSHSLIMAPIGCRDLWIHDMCKIQCHVKVYWEKVLLLGELYVLCAYCGGKNAKFSNPLPDCDMIIIKVWGILLVGYFIQRTYLLHDSAILLDRHMPIGKGFKTIIIFMIHLSRYCNIKKKERFVLWTCMEILVSQ